MNKPTFHAILIPKNNVVIVRPLEDINKVFVLLFADDLTDWCDTWQSIEYKGNYYD
jgi:hypothetical protein